MVRLGAGGLDGKALTPTAMTPRPAGLRSSGGSRIARRRRDHRGGHQRDARSRERRRLPRRRHASRPASASRVISGTEEARLIHLAAAYGVDLGGGRGVVIDIGGGSIEITLGTAERAQLGTSFKIGVIRLTERFVPERSAVRRATSGGWSKHINQEIGELPRADRQARLPARHRHVGHDPEPRRVVRAPSRRRGVRRRPQRRVSAQGAAPAPQAARRV